MKITRRGFVGSSVAAAVLGAAGRAGAQQKKAPAVHVRAAQPVVIASGNGNTFKNGGPRTCVHEAFLRMTKGADVLDALLAGVNIVENDPLEDGVGYGGLPNAEGVVQLDSSCMHGPRKRAGAVACLEGVRNPSLVAKAVMEHTDHHLLVGRDAQTFARQMGFKIEADLNTEGSRKTWLEWRRQIDPGHWLDPKKRSEAGERARRVLMARGMIDAEHAWGTINCNGVNARGDLCGVTTTSGLPFKIPGRVGDSPILGAGLYVDGDVGAAGSTGRGEANLYGLSSFLVVERLRAGASPKDAGMEALRRIVERTVEKRLLFPNGRPNFNVTFYVVNKRGVHAGVALYGGGTYAACTDKGPESLPIEGLLGDMPKDADL